MRNEMVSERLRSVAARQCPVTSGAAVKMTLAGFKRACVARQKEGKARRCLECKGLLLPEELIVIEIGSIIKEGEEMSKREPGTCSCCEKEKNVKMYCGALACSYCEVLMINAKNQPKVVAKVLRKFAPELFTVSAPALDNGSDKLRISELEQEIKELIEDKSILQQSYDGLRKKADTATTSTNTATQDLALRLAIAILRDKAAGLVTIDDVEMLRNC